MTDVDNVLKMEMKRFSKTLTNFIPDVNERGEEIKRPREALLVWKDVDRYLDGRLKRCQKIPFFVQPDGEIRMINDSAELFGFLFSKGMAIEWSDHTVGAINRREFHKYIGTIAQNYDLVTSLPHFPPMERIYYSRTITPIANGSFDKLIRKFNYATEIDRQKLMAMFITPLWGGPGGSRPAFLIDGLENDSVGNRGIGKTSITDALGHLYGDCVDLSSKTEGEDIRKRILTAGDVRLIRMDNIKASSLSNDTIESLITARRISGHKIYSGHQTIPNWFCFVMTFNDAVLSKDLAQRTMIIRLKRPKYAANWFPDIVEFIDKNRELIMSDIAAIFETPTISTTSRTRFPLWEREVLARVCDDITSVLDNDEVEKAAVDEDTVLKEELTDIFKEKLGAYWRMEHLGHERIYFDPENCNLAILRSTAMKWVADHINHKATQKYLAKKLTAAKPNFLYPEPKVYDGNRYLLWAPRGALKSDGFKCWRIRPCAEKVITETWETTIDDFSVH